MRNRALAAALVAHLAACARAPAEVPTIALPASAPAPPPSADAAAPLTEMRVDPATSKISFVMEAPQEKIRGEIRGVEGKLLIDPADPTRARGTITADLDRLELFQTRVDDQGKGAERKIETQNRHARQWLEIAEDAPEAERARNRRVVFSITRVEAMGSKLKATGDLLLHGVKLRKTAVVGVELDRQQGALMGVSVGTAEPFAVGLAEHDVRPRDAFGKLAMKSLEALAPKVAKEAMVSLELRAGTARVE